MSDIVTKEEIEAKIDGWRERAAKEGVHVSWKFIWAEYDRIGKPRDWRPPDPPTCPTCGKPR